MTPKSIMSLAAVTIVAVAAAVVGGCSLAGGIGTISGIVLGALFLRVVIDAIAKTVKSNPDDFEGMIVGFLVVLAVTFNELRSQKEGHKKFFPGSLGIVNIFSLTVLMGIVVMLVVGDGKIIAGCIAAGLTGALLVTRRWFESRADAGQVVAASAGSAVSFTPENSEAAAETGKQEADDEGEQAL